MKRYSLDEIKYINIHGRHTKNLRPLALFWTGSGIEVNIKASELWLEVEIDYDLFEQWIVIEINGSAVSRQMLCKGKYSICLFRNMDKNKTKNVRIYKETQAMPSDNNCVFLIHSLKTDGTFERISPRKTKIEFLGDSITSGEGIVGAKEEDEWISMLFSSYYNYATMIAKELDADYRIISQSGYGVLSGWDNNPNCALPEYYEKICGVVNGERNIKLGAKELNNFKEWQPDIIIVNLGTNDEGAFESSEFQDIDTGKVFKQHKNEDGSYNENDMKRLEESIVKFLYKLRYYNSNSKIIWCYGMLGDSIINNIKNGIEEYKDRTEDSNVFVIQLTSTNKSTIGARSHPGILNHKIASSELVAFIKSNIK